MDTVTGLTEQQRAAARVALARVASLLYDRRLTELQGGNMSLRIGDEVVITPTKASENDGWRLTAEDMVVHDLEGGVLAGDPARVSRETRLHLRLYRAFDDVGSVFHLHLPEALGAAAAGRWEPGVITADTDAFGVPLCLLETGLPAQTEPHDSRVEALLGSVPRAAGAVSISPGHGVVSVAATVASNVRAVDVLRQRLEEARLRGRLRVARSGGRT
ncbi:MAG TPA: class II aldolase/adducin family protein [Candidatus Limnocylindrales bacterium]|nr:class II aldolase/adducin family protein [Candidatus Limnocylindrales bacterium]